MPRVVSKCEHGYYKAYCKPCGGRRATQICKHDQIKSVCRTCKYKPKLTISKKRKTNQCSMCNKKLSFAVSDKFVCRECKKTIVCIHKEICNTCPICIKEGRCHHLNLEIFCETCKLDKKCQHDKITFKCDQCNLKNSEIPLGEIISLSQL